MKWGTFVPSDDIGFFPQLFLMTFYGYILYTASKTISDGSEMLLSLYGPGIIGGLVIPILGAVPDAAIILVSGLGNKAEVQEQISVGVGTLAGSTIMLLTIPWAAGAYLGRRDIENGVAASVRVHGKSKPKLTHFSWYTNGVTVDSSVPVFSKIMMVSAISFLIIQVPAFFDKNSKNASHKEAPFALVGFIITSLGFIAYSVYQVVDARHDEFVRQQQREADRTLWKASLKHKLGHVRAVEEVFDSFDHDGNGQLDRAELTEALRCLGLQVDRKEVSQIIRQMDTNQDNLVSKEEFATVIAKWMDCAAQRNLEKPDGGDEGKANGGREHITESVALTVSPKSGYASIQDKDQDEPTKGLNQPLIGSPTKGFGSRVSLKPSEEEEEEAEEEEEYHDLTDSQIKMRAGGLLLLGTLMVTAFSDPMVEVINNFGKTIGVSPFYVSFIITPMASNASEVISAMVFAKRKTKVGMSLTMSSLYGAATMNNTLGLSIFMALVYFRKLTWSFSAEVISILLVTYVVGINGLSTTIKLWQCIIVGAMFPLSLLLVALLENVAGLD